MSLIQSLYRSIRLLQSSLMGALFSILAYILYPLLEPGPTTPKVYFGTSPTHIRLQKSKDPTQTDTTLSAFVESKVPSLFSPFTPAWWLPGGHLQTMYCVVGDFSKIDTVVWDRKYLRLVDGGTLGLDFTNTPHIPDNAPIIVVLHGLTGGSHESYVRNIIAPACKPVELGGLGYRGVVINFRGCAGVPLTSPRLYSAGSTDDLRQGLLYIRKRYPTSRLLGLGFSLGANIVTKYLAEEGENSRLNSCCAVACPWDLVDNAIVLNHSGPISKYIYSKALGGNLQNLAKRHLETLRNWQGHPVHVAAENAAALNKPTLEEFDDHFTRVGGGYHKPLGPFPFKTAWDYYRWASSLPLIGDIRVPFLAINATDDPVVQKCPTKAGGNGYCALGLTPSGGHLGWFESDGIFGTKRWVCRPVLEWLRAVGEDLAYDGPKGAEIYVEDGFLKEVGREQFGCREVEGDDVAGHKYSGTSLLQGL